METIKLGAKLALVGLVNFVTRHIWLVIALVWMIMGDTNMALFMFFLSIYFKLDDIKQELE